MFPGCCCDKKCWISRSTIADESLPEFTQVGTPVVLAGVVTLQTGDALVFTTPSGDREDGVRVYARVRKTIDGTIRLRIAQFDEDNYLFGDLVISSGSATIQTGRRSAGVDSFTGSAQAVNDTGSELDQFTTVCLEWAPGPLQEAITQTTTDYISPIGVIGETGWVNPNNVLVDDASFAVYNFPSSGTTEDTTLLTVQLGQALVPEGATIDDVSVHVRAFYGVPPFPPGITVIDRDYILTSAINGPFPDKATGTSLATVESDVDRLWTEADGVTWVDLADGVSVILSFRRSGGTTGGSISVQYVTLGSVTYTTPEQAPGRLKMSYLNSGSSNNAQCHESPAINAPITAGVGLKAGISVEDGEFEVSEITYAYTKSDTRPYCKNCGNNQGKCTPQGSDDNEPNESDPDGGGDGNPCTACSGAPYERLVLNVPGVTFTNTFIWGRNCLVCRNVPEAFVLQQRDYEACVWTYFRLFNDCEVTLYDPGSGPRWSTNAAWEARISLSPADNSGIRFRWYAWVHLGGSTVLAEGYAGIIGFYESDIVTKPINCRQMPVNLTLVEVWEGNNLICDGTMPANATIDI